MTGPPLSVIVASSNDVSLLTRCIEALSPQATPDNVELIVVRALDRPIGVERRVLMALAPQLRWIDAPAGATVPRLRGLGIAASRGALVALLEDDCLVADDWCREAISTRGSAAAVGGAVEPGPYQRALDWAVYFCEYGRFMLPVPTASDAPLTGNNVVYSRRAIDALAEESRVEFREAFVHAAWQHAGVPTRVSGSLVVRNVNTWSWAHVTSVPFHHGRTYAAQRFGPKSPAVRIAIAVLALGLPLVKATRIAAETLSRRRLAGQLARAWPLILVFVLSWSAGELAGCLWGPGSSPSRWR